MKFFSPSIGRAGRIFRAVLGGVLLVAGLALTLLRHLWAKFFVKSLNFPRI
jgi:hypothetical protein